MIFLIIRRLFFGLLTLWVVSVLIFVGTEILPGDVASARLGQTATPETLAAIREELRLDRPAVERYVGWLSDFLRGDLGISLAQGLGQSGRRVTDLIKERAWNTVWLAGLAAIFAVPLSVGLGVLSAAFHRSKADHTISILSLLAISLPEFFTGALMVVLFAVKWKWFPAMSYISELASPAQRLHALVLPTLTLTFALAAYIARMTRATVLDVLRLPYVEMATLKGVSKSRIIFCHTLPNAFGPIANVIALTLGYLVTSVVFVEAVFAYPGLGRQMVDAVSTRDTPTIQAIAMIFCTVYVVLNLLADIFAMATNPRLRFPK